MVCERGVLMRISGWVSPLVGVQKWPDLNSRQDQLDLLMQHNVMASSGKKGSSTLLQHAEHSLICLNIAVLTTEKCLASAAVHTASMDKSQFVFEC